MRPFSPDLRHRIVAARDAGQPTAVVAARFSVFCLVPCAATVNAGANAAPLIPRPILAGTAGSAVLLRRCCANRC